MQVEICREKIDRAQLPSHALASAERELARLAKLTPAEAEYTIISDYIDWLTGLPWNRSSDSHISPQKARDMLREDLLGVKAARERILEHMAIWHINPELRFPTFCLTGPTGTGKRTLARAVARSLGRKFLHISTDELLEESELRGEWRAKVGNRPGLIIRMLKECGENDPVILIEGIDRADGESRSRLISALLEITHPERNHLFQDRYLNVAFDLSKAVFIATAGSPYSIPEPFRDVFEIVRLPGYTTRVKLEIASNHLAPKRLTEAGLEGVKFSMPAIREIVENYTHEAGVHELDRRIAEVCRKLSADFGTTRRTSATIDAETIRRLLGPPVVSPEMIGRFAEVGIATALVLTRTGATVSYVEATRMIGQGKVRITGKPPDAVEELVQMSLSYIKSHAEELEVPAERIAESDIHIHFPGGILEEDCASLGLAVIIQLVSLFTEMPVHSDFAFSGEISIRGKVLPVEGIEEKVFAAHRSAISKVFLPGSCKRDISRLPEEIRSEIEFILVDDVSSAIQKGLMKIILPNKNLKQTIENLTRESSETSESE